ncbi:MAG: hypothetical protein IPK15_06380 [Verrucomicrobia bacterium]|nr:hypothetical protein [Verrucomicrobiota bacterium]
MTIDPTTIAMFVGVVVVTAVKWLVYIGLLWGMIRIQKLNYNVLGLFGSSLAATLVAFIPYVGTYLSYAVIVLCIWKCTGAEIAPDVLFTVIISNALMFCFNLFVIGALMGDIRPDLSANARDDASFADFANADAGNEGGMEDEDSEDLDEVPIATNAAPAVAAAPKVAAAGPLRLKGITLNSLRPSAMVSDGTRVYTIFAGDSFTADIGNGRARFRCEEISKAGVVLSNGEGERLQLRLP